MTGSPYQGKRTDMKLDAQSINHSQTTKAITLLLGISFVFETISFLISQRLIRAASDFSILTCHYYRLLTELTISSTFSIQIQLIHL